LFFLFKNSRGGQIWLLEGEAGWLHYFESAEKNRESSLIEVLAFLDITKSLAHITNINKH
jgi:hypothetical protein